MLSMNTDKEVYSVVQVVEETPDRSLPQSQNDSAVSKSIRIAVMRVTDR